MGSRETPASGLKEEFGEYYFSRYRRHLQVSALSALVIYCLFGLLDYLLYPKEIGLLALMRYGIVTPVVMACVLYLYRGRSARWAQGLYAAALAIGGTEVGAVVIVSGDPHQLYYTGFILTLVFTYAISGLRLPYAWPSAAAMSTAFCAMLWIWPVVPEEVVVNDIFGIIATNMAGIAAGYLLEHHRLQEFKYLRRLEQERNGLAADNVRLTYLSSHDGLTGISNRYTFDTVLAKEWRRARRHRYPLALIMVDIDDFKAYNDTAGHLAGDAALRGVAQVLIENVSRPGDLAARYGGEEFAVLLAGADIEGAMKKGEEIVRAVRRLRIEHPASPRGFLTVSVGCSAMVPDDDADELDLVGAADEALYRAKSSGKDRVSS